MANQEHLTMLKQGVEHWNRWRQEHRDTWPDLSEADLSEADLSSADLSSAALFKANLRKADLSGTNLSSARAINADFSGANLSSANLGGANLKGAILMSANLSRANLSSAILSYADLRDANFKDSVLNNADLSLSDLKDANFEGAELWYTMFVNVDLSSVKGLDDVKHFGPAAEISISTIYQSQGKISVSFLRKAGVPETFITNMHALVKSMGDIDFYSCFISYSSKNDALARRLYADLQVSGVRCWFAPEDMKIGDKIRPRIDEAIHQQDKLLLVLSEHALASAWVEDEVEAALEKERRQQREVLFPVRLDESVMQTTQAWAAKLRRTRHIGDFSRWAEPQAYRQAFERLLRDLKAEVKQ